MKTFTIAIKDVEDVKSFINMGESDYISVLIVNNGVYFMSDDGELYTHMYFTAVSKFEITEMIMFRLLRQTFTSLLVEGFVEFRLDSENIILLYKDKTSVLKYRFKTKYQGDLPEKYLHRLDIIQEISRYPTVDITKLGYLLRVGKAINAPIKCTESIGSINTKSSIVFTKIEGSRFACSAKLLSLLYRYTTGVYNVQNYLVYNSIDKVIMVTKYRESFDSDLDFMLEQRTQFRVNFNPKNMIDLCRKVKLSNGNFILDLEHEKVEFIEEVNTYETNVEVFDVVSAKSKEKEEKKDEEFSLDSIDLDINESVDMEQVNKELSNNIPRLLIPSNIIKGVIMQLPTAKRVFLIIKKRFVVLKIGPVNVVFGRKDC